jgi:hypothetical protein
MSDLAAFCHPWQGISSQTIVKILIEQVYKNGLQETIWIILQVCFII